MAEIHLSAISNKCVTLTNYLLFTKYGQGTLWRIPPLCWPRSDLFRNCLFFFDLSYFLSYPSLNIHFAFACWTEILWALSAIFLQTHIFICFWLFMFHSNFITHIPRKTLIQEANESNQDLFLLCWILTCFERCLSISTECLWNAPSQSL